MNTTHTADCNFCPSQSECGASGFRPVAAAFRQIRDYIRVSGPAPGAPCLTTSSPTDFYLRQTARKLAQARKDRGRYLPESMLGEPAWDILLELFCSTSPQSMKSICHGAGVPLTTTLRWVTQLEQQGLLTQQPDPGDARRTLVSLTEKGVADVTEAVNGIRAVFNDRGVEL